MNEGATAALIPDIDALVSENEKLRQEIERLSFELDQLKRMIFGHKSERFVPSDPSQMSLDFGEVQEKEQKEDELEELTYTRRKRKQQPVRTEIPANLPRVEELIEPEYLPEGAKKIGEVVSEVLEYNPARIFVRRIVRPKYALPDDEGVTIGRMPQLPLPKSNAGPGLIAHILVSKFVDHLPFYRQRQIFRRQDIELSKSTINGWFNGGSDLLIPLYKCLKDKVLHSDYLMADESPIPVQDNHKKGATHTGYQWVYYSPVKKIVCFDYRPGRGRAGPNDFLQNYKGVLQSDGYSGYNQFEKNPSITLHACMAHARRKFEAALKYDPVRSGEVLKLIARLYEIERYANEEQMSDAQRYVLRMDKAAPAMRQLEQWLENHRNDFLPKSPMGKAVHYTVALWPRLKRYLDDGKYEIDNNAIERSIRPLALGRKNYLFAGSHEAAQRAAMMYSFFGTCKMQGVEPFEWLRTTLRKIPQMTAMQMRTLLPVK